MTSVAIVVLAGTEQHSDLARVLNALELARECQAAEDRVEVIFDGAGVSWIPLLADPEHELHKVFISVQENIAGACEFCCGAFDVKDAVREAGVPFLSEFEGHPSLRNRIAEGFQVVTF